jgi:hypothetical protein
MSTAKTKRQIVKETVRTIRWIATADELPDEDIIVLVFSPSESEPVWPGYFDGQSADGDTWRTASGHRIEVTHWAELPTGPTVDQQPINGAGTNERHD